MEESFLSCEGCGEGIQITHGGLAQPDEEITCSSCGRKYILEVPEDETDQPYLMDVEG